MEQLGNPVVELTNNSTVELEISFIAVELFKNNLNPNLLKRIKNTVVSPGALPIICNFDGPPEDVTDGFYLSGHTYPLHKDTSEAKLSIPIESWKKIAFQCDVFSKSEAFLRSDSTDGEIRYYIESHEFEEGTLGTRILFPGEKYTISPIYFVKARKDQMIGIVFNLLFDKGVDIRKNYYSIQSIINLDTLKSTNTSDLTDFGIRSRFNFHDSINQNRRYGYP